MYIWMFVIGTVVTLIVIYLVNQANTNPAPPANFSSTANSRFSSGEMTMNQINAISSSERRIIAEAIGCDVYNLSSIDNLAISTVLIEKTIKLSTPDTYLCKSTLCSCDTTILTLFVVRALSMCACPTKEKACYFNDYYVPLVIKGIKFRYGNAIPELDEMISNRTSFYDRIFMSKDSLDDKLNAVFDEFEFILKTDCIEKKYVPFSETSPLPILGMPADFTCQAQVALFRKNILRFLAPYYKEMMDDMLL